VRRRARQGSPSGHVAGRNVYGGDAHRSLRFAEYEEVVDAVGRIGPKDWECAGAYPGF